MIELDSNTSAAWLASTVRRKLNVSALEDVDISATTRRVSNTRQLQGLRIEGHLMYGVARLIAQKSQLLSSKTEETRRDLERELDFQVGRVTHEKPSSPELISQSQTLEMISSDFNLDRIVDEFRPTQSQPDYDDDYDMPPPDTELRYDDEEPDDELRDDANDSFDDPGMLNEGDEQVLRNILGQESQDRVDEQQTVDVDMAAFGDEGQEALTSEPEYEPEETQDTELTGPVKKKRASRKRLCPVDDQINIARNTRAPSNIIANTNQQQDVQAIDEGDFFDPTRIAEIIKRRKLATAQEPVGDVPEELPDLAYSDQADISIAGVSIDGLMDVDDDSPMLDFHDNNDEDAGEFDHSEGVNAFGATQLIGSLAEDDNLEELMAQEIRAARQAIKQVKDSEFSAIPAASKRSRAALFSEMLALATQGELTVSQPEPYAEIHLAAVGA